MAWIAGRDHGTIAAAELRACGLSRDAIASRVRRGWLHPKHRGVYAVGHPALTPRGRFMAAVKACGPTAALSHASAAMLHGFLDELDGHTPHVTVLGGWTRERPGITVHRSARIERTLVDGIPVTTPARTLIDLAATTHRRQLRSAVNRALARKRVTIPLLIAEVVRHPGRRGNANLRATLATAAPTRSELEDALLALVHAGGLQPPDVNRPLSLSGRKVIPDLRWPAQRLTVEADGRAWHDTPLARHDDAERQRVLERHGDTVIRITWRQLAGDPTRTLARLTDAGAPSKYPAPR